MKQIIIIGCPGSGKTYFAKQLSEILQIELFHMDNIYWKKDKTHSSRGELVCTVDEINNFHLSSLKLSYEEAIREYEYRSNTRLGKLIANRELPVLHRAKEIIDI